MKKIAVIGKPGSGKSTLSKSLVSATGIKLYALDSIIFKKNGERVDRVTYDEEHEKILSSDNWIIDGLCPKFWNDSFMQKIEKISTNKSLYVIRSVSELDSFVDKNVK